MRRPAEESIEMQANGERKDARKNREWLERLKTFTEKSSISKATYGFRISKSWCERFFWSMILLVVGGGFGGMMFLHFKSTIVDEPSSTTINEQRHQALEFPAMTICSLSFLNSSRLEQNLRATDELDTLFTSAHVERPPNIASCMSAADAIANTSNYHSGFGTLITDTGRIDPTELIQQCTFLDEDCCQNFTQIPTVSGVCFTFSTSRKIPGAGSRYGLRLELSNGNQHLSLNDNYGYNVIIHNRDEPPRPDSEGIVIGQNSALYVGLRRKVTVDGTKYSYTSYSGQKCVSASGEHLPNDQVQHNFSIPSYPFYSPPLCLNDCLYSHVAAECNCVERQLYTPVRPPYTEMRDCNVRDICCEVVAFNTFTESECSQCPRNCTTTGWHLTTSSATIGPRNDVAIYVYYETLITETSQISDSFTEWGLISATGGMTGIFLGFPLLLAFGEMLLLVVGLVTGCCKVVMCGRKQRAQQRWIAATTHGDIQSYPKNPQLGEESTMLMTTVYDKDM